MTGLALSYSNLGRNQEALDLYEQTLDLRKLLLGNEHLNTHISMNALTKFYSKLGRQGSSTVASGRYYLPGTTIPLSSV